MQRAIHFTYIRGHCCPEDSEDLQVSSPLKYKDTFVAPLHPCGGHSFTSLLLVKTTSFPTCQLCSQTNSLRASSHSALIVLPIIGISFAFYISRHLEPHISPVLSDAATPIHSHSHKQCPGRICVVFGEMLMHQLNNFKDSVFVLSSWFHFFTSRDQTCGLLGRGTEPNIVTKHILLNQRAFMCCITQTLLGRRRTQESHQHVTILCCAESLSAVSGSLVMQHTPSIVFSLQLMERHTMYYCLKAHSSSNLCHALLCSQHTVRSICLLL